MSTVKSVLNSFTRDEEWSLLDKSINISLDSFKRNTESHIESLKDKFDPNESKVWFVELAKCCTKNLCYSSIVTSQIRIWHPLNVFPGVFCR